MTDEKIKLLEETPNEAAQLLRVDLQLFNSYGNSAGKLGTL